MEPKKDVRYNVALGPKLEAELDRVADELHVSKAEVLRRALNLFTYAVDADEVRLITKGSERSVLVK